MEQRRHGGQTQEASATVSHGGKGSTNLDKDNGQERRLRLRRFSAGTAVLGETVGCSDLLALRQHNFTRGGDSWGGANPGGREAEAMVQHEAQEEGDMARTREQAERKGQVQFNQVPIQ